MKGNTESTVEIAPSRRSMIKKITAGATASTLLPGMAAADDGAENERQEPAKGRTSDLGQKQEPLSRAEKAAKEGKEWNEEWINEDRIDDEKWVIEEPVVKEVDAAQDATIQGAAQGGRRMHREIGIKGVKLVIDAYLGNCNAWVDVKALGQSVRATFDCSSGLCDYRHLDAGAAYVNIDTCVNWQSVSFTQDIEVCVWHLTGWSCGSTTIHLG